MNGMTGSVELAFKIDGKIYSPEKALNIETQKEGKLLIEFLTETIEVEEKEVIPEPTKEEINDAIDKENVMNVSDVVAIRMGKKDVKVISKEE